MSKESTLEVATCTACRITKDLDDFSRRAAPPNGRQLRCKACQSALRRGKRPEQQRMADVRRQAKVRLKASGLATCCRCGATKSLDDFNKNPMSANGRESYCRECRTVVNAENADSRRDQYVFRTYGIHRDALLEMVKAQNNRCLICGQEGDLVIDHDHATGVVRGLLCRGCNTGIGLLGDDCERMRSAIAYLSGAARAANTRG